MITLIMEAASTSETSVNFYKTTWHNNPQDSHLPPREPQISRHCTEKVLDICTIQFETKASNLIILVCTQPLL
jgi:hypothetical protein